MTINHIYVMVHPSAFQSLTKFYTTLLAPLSYTVYHTSPALSGLGTNYPYFWLQALPPNTTPVPTHIAFDAKDEASVDAFYAAALAAGAKDNGPPGLRKDMGKAPYYTAYVLDAEGNNVEAVFVNKDASHPDEKS